jgi:TolB-like protein/Flp pilus assembly protein TadD
MPSLVPGYEYDIFISYRQKDNKYDGWVTDFVQNLKKELDATFKEDISIYFDENPHDGLLETHDVDDSLKSKLRCLVFIPILSRTYCDPNCFAWQNEFVAFNRLAEHDRIGPQITLRNGNITGRVLPIRIHELEHEDVLLVERELKRKLRPVDFIFKAPGVNRPLRAHEDNPRDNLEHTYYRDQINKVAHFISEMIDPLKREQAPTPASSPRVKEAEAVNIPVSEFPFKTLLHEVGRRHILRAALAYFLFSIVGVQVAWIGKYMFGLPDALPFILGMVLLILFPVAVTLAWFYEMGPKGFIRIGSAEAHDNPYSAARKKPLTGNLIMLVLVILLIVQNVYIGNFEKEKDGTLISVHEGEKSIAVLPFENRGEPVNEYFSDGLTEDINVQLSKINELRVIAAAALRTYKNSQASVSVIAEELGVSYVLIGSIQRNNNQLRIAPQLIDGKTKKLLWGDVFNLSQEGLFEVQSEIAQRIASVLKIKLSEVELKLMNKHPTSSLTAYDYYLKGRSHYYQYNADDNDLAIENFKRAIALDPRFSLAWAGLGDAYNQRFGRFAQGAQWIDSAVYASRKAIALDSAVSEGFKSLASAYYYLTRYDSSRKLMEKAVQLNPNNIAAVGNLGTSYFMDGELPEALRWQKKSAGLNPRNFIPYQIAGWIYRLMGDYENAERWLKKSIELKAEYDTYELLAYVYVCMGKKKDALDLIPHVIKLDEDDPLVVETAGLIAHFAGDHSEAKKYFQHNLEKHHIVSRDAQFTGNIHLGQIYLHQDKNIVDAEVLLSNALEVNMNEINNGSLDRAFPFNVAGIYAIRGMPQEAVKWIDKAMEVNWMDYAQLTHGPWFASMRSHPELLKRVDLLKQKMEQMRLKSSSVI